MSETQTIIHGEPAKLPLDCIDIEEGFNPRQFRPPHKQDELNQSIGQQGIVQPIAVRPNPDNTDRYLVIAGEGRYHGATYNQLPDVPVLIFDVDRSRAYALAQIENAQREDLAPTEEALAARTTLEYGNQDEAEACRQLGWSEKKCRHRMKLLHCSDAVQDALNRRTINLGHAELLATLPEKTQDGTLEKIVNEGVSVEALKEKLDAYARYLKSAPFDTTECQGCPYNTSSQDDLFDATIGDGRCTNADCWNEKTEAHLESLRQQQQAEHPVVWFDREKDPNSYTYLQSRGTDGVGPEQYAACQAECKDFGAMMATKPGQEGKLLSDSVCFNLECHAKKKQAYQDSIQADKTDESDTAQTGNTTSSSSKDKPKKAGSSKQASTAGAPKKVIETCNQFYHDMARQIMASRPDLGQAMHLAIAVGTFKSTLDGHQFGQSEEWRTQIKKPVADWLEQQGISGTKFTDLFDACRKVDDDTREQAHTKIAQTMVGMGYQCNGCTISDMLGLAKHIIRSTEADPADYFVIDENFLRAHTKAGIKSMLAEEAIGFDRWYDEQYGDGTYTKLMNKKIDEIITAVMNSGFEFNGKVPKAIHDNLKK